MKNLYFGLDLGHYEVKLAVVEESPDGRLLTYNTAIKNDYFRKGEIIDQLGFINLLESIFTNVLDSFGVRRIEKINICLNLPNLQVKLQKGHAMFENNVSKEIVLKTIRIARNFLLINNQEVLLEEPIKFVIDGTQEVRDPIGFSGRRLDTEVLFVLAHKSFIEKLTEIFKNVGINISQILPATYSASKVCLSKKNKEIGIGLLDIGAEVSSLGIFQDGKLVNLFSFNWGIESIFYDILLHFKKSEEDLSEIKEIIFSAEDKEVKRDKKSKTKNQIINFFEKKLKEDLEKIGLIDSLKKVKKEYKLPSGLVLLGGLAYYPYVENLLKNFFDLPIKLPKDKMNLFEDNKDLIKFSPAVGAALILREEKDYGWFQKIKDFWSNYFSK